MTAILRLEAEGRAANMTNDLAWHEANLAPAWRSINANGSVTTKERLLDLLRSPHSFNFVSVEDSEVVVDASSDLGVVIGLSTRVRKGGDGEDVTATVRFGRVYARDSASGRWLLVHSQQTPVI
jgi:hypothetical protein